VKDSVIVFDWDDTLLPTSVTQGNKGAGLEGALLRHALLVEEVLRAASAVAHVSIVTLSKRPWIEMSAKRHFPNVDFAALFRELDISVRYAGEHGPRPQTNGASIEEYQLLKRNAMASCITERINSGSLGFSRLSLLSIGDSIVEQQAAKELVAFWGAAGTFSGKAVCKTLKFLDEPSVPQLDVELRQLLQVLPGLVKAERSCNLAMEMSAPQYAPPPQMQHSLPPASAGFHRNVAWPTAAR
jgi:hypothetical protein